MLDEALKRKRIQLEKDGWDILSLLKKNSTDDECQADSEDDSIEMRPKRSYRKRVDKIAITSKEDRDLL